MELRATFYNLHRKLSMCLVAEIDCFKQTSENVCILIYQLVRDGTVISIISVRLRHRKMFYELIHRLLSFLMSVLAQLHVVIEISIEHCVFYIIKSVSHSDIGKNFSFVKTPPSDRNRCVVSGFYMCVFNPSVSVSRLVQIVLHHSPSRKDGNR